MTIKTKIDTKSEEFFKKNEKELIENGLVTFVVVAGEDVDFGKTYKFHREDIIKIGRNPDRDIALSDERVSSDHCQLNILKSPKGVEQILINDLDSTNGTYVNGDEISKSVLKNGDKIKVGKTILRFSINDQIESTYHSKLFKLAIMDTLTGLFNKRYIMQSLENNFKVAARNKRDLSLLIFDIDDFKKINDVYGHVAGDEYLRVIGGVLNNSLREQDICGRYGGEEFFVILPETGLDGSMKVGEKVRSRVEALKVFFNDSQINSTISGGFCCLDDTIKNAKELITRADEALYKAKTSGKNRIIDAAD